VFVRLGSPFNLADRLELLAWLLLVPSLSSFMAMNFTGASTYTSLSGVLKEMRLAIPVQIVSAGLGSILWCIAIFV
jgi:acetyl-CoA decarbonylase/synthase complex subunit gamma